MPKVGRNVFPNGVEPGSFEASIIEGEANAVRAILGEERTLDQVVQLAANAAHCADRLTERIAEPGEFPKPACQEGCSYCCYLAGVTAGIPEALSIAEHLRERAELGPG